MEIIKWFERRFDLNLAPGLFPGIMERLRGTPARLEELLQEIRSNQYMMEIANNRWSIKENIGHLSDLEPLWFGRFEDLKNKLEFLREADLENKKTYNAGHNGRSLSELLYQFRQLRLKSVIELENMDKSILKFTSLHPRLKTPLTILDLTYFIAEHDDHHLAKINEIKKVSDTKNL